MSAHNHRRLNLLINNLRFLCYLVPETNTVTASGSCTLIIRDTHIGEWLWKSYLPSPGSAGRTMTDQIPDSGRHFLLSCCSNASTTLRLPERKQRSYLHLIRPINPLNPTSCIAFFQLYCDVCTKLSLGSRCCNAYTFLSNFKALMTSAINVLDPVLRTDSYGYIFTATDTLWNHQSRKYRIHCM